jgi:anionic cell wall polymer biosynthesis LytR-Cps2A-Psr (LCP) family protein
VDEQVTSIHIGVDRSGRFAKPFLIYDDGTVGPANRGVTPVVYKVGNRHFSDWEALDYCRQRDLLANGDGDYGRQRHQQQFIKAVARKVASTGIVTNPSRIEAVLNAAGKAVTFDRNGIDLKDWIFTLKGLNSEGITMIKTNAGLFHSEKIGGRDYETLNDTSLDLFAAIRSDKVGEFVLAHPEWVSTDT